MLPSPVPPSHTFPPMDTHLHSHSMPGALTLPTAQHSVAGSGLSGPYTDLWKHLGKGACGTDLDRLWTLHPQVTLSIVHLRLPGHPFSSLLHACLLQPSQNFIQKRQSRSHNLAGDWQAVGWPVFTHKVLLDCSHGHWFVCLS